MSIVVDHGLVSDSARGRGRLPVSLATSINLPSAGVWTAHSPSLLRVLACGLVAFRKSKACRRVPSRSDPLGYI
jgi:hypothetical protein